MAWKAGSPIRSASASVSATQTLRQIQQLVQRGNLAEAERHLTEGLNEFPREAPFYDLQGVVEAQKGNYREAERNFLKAMDLDPLLTGAYLNLGHLYQQNMGSDHEALQKALGVYGKLLKIDPASAEAPADGRRRPVTTRSSRAPQQAV